MKIRLPVLCLLSTGCWLFTSCGLPQPQADTVRRFTLGGDIGATPVANATQVRPVNLAGHLHRRSMAVRVAEHELTYLDEVRWAEPLDTALTRILQTRLASVPGGATVTVNIERFELVRYAGNSVQLEASYTILPAGAPKDAVKRGVFTSSARTWDGKDPGDLVGLLHDAAVELGDAIAAAVAKLPAAAESK